MMVMPGNNTGQVVKDWAVEYPGQLGHLMGPEFGGWRYPWLPYALDNGAYGCHTRGERWKQREYLGLCEKAVDWQRGGGQPPLWLLVPDVVKNREETLRSWEAWEPSLRSWYGWPLAFAVQDGMTPADIPQEAQVLFLGGGTDWKREQLRGEGHDWAAQGRPLHVGRVNGYQWLWASVSQKAVSCDGNGWFRGDKIQLAGLEQFLQEWRAGHRVRPNGPLWEEASATP